MIRLLVSFATVCMFLLIAAGCGPSEISKINNMNICKTHLGFIQTAKGQWIAEKKVSRGSPVVDAEVNKYLQKIPECPVGGTYTYGLAGAAPECSIGSSDPAYPHVLSNY